MCKINHWIKKMYKVLVYKIFNKMSNKIVYNMSNKISNKIVYKIVYIIVI